MIKFDKSDNDEIPEGWVVETIKDLPIDIIDGDRGRNYPTKSEFEKNGFCLFLNTKNVPGEQFNFGECNFVNEERDRLLRKGKLQKGDIVLTTRGTVGNIAYYHKRIPHDHIRINSGMVIIRNSGERFNTDYLYHLLKSPLVKCQYLSFVTGSAQPQLPIRDINKIRLTVPPVVEQRAIAKILSDLDEKIEMNHRMNQTLEAIAQAIFKRWFVDFNFPDENGRPYKDSGGRVIDSELGEIPDEWEVENMDDVVTVKGGATPSTQNSKFWEGGDIFWCTPRDLSQLLSPVLLNTERKITEVGLQSISSGLLEKGVLLLSSRAPIGYLAISEIPISINQGFIAILCNRKVSNYFMYFWAHENLSRIKNMANGSTFQEINKANFRKIKMIVPPESVLRQFDCISSGLWDAIVNNEKQNRELSQIRDSLLPKLMSGKIRVR